MDAPEVFPSLLSENLSEIFHSNEIEKISFELELHLGRTARIAGMVARELGFASSKVKVIEKAAGLHDVGKVKIPDEILNKPAPLTEDERRIMKQHVLFGFSMVQSIPGLEEAAYYLQFHHERLDGMGYPFGLHERDIPMESRIISIADAFDAITSQRAYKPACSVGQALEEISKSAGNQFDFDCVEALFALDLRSRLII